MTTRAVLYARVSSDDTHTQGRNLAGQLELCRQHAHTKGWKVVAELAEDDRGASGAELNLPQLAQMLAMARGGEFDVLIVREIDRLSRNLAKQLFIEDELKQASVQVEYVLGDYADTPEGNFLKNVRASVAELERMKIIERTARGRRRAVEAGNVHVGKHPPYGYRVVDREGRRTLEPREDEARIVRLIFQWYTEGGSDGETLSLWKMAARLTEMGVPTYSQKRAEVAYNQKVMFPGRWASATLHCLLKNELYLGRWQYGKQPEQSDSPADPAVEGPIVVEIPAIVDPQSWEKAQARLAYHKQHAKRNRKYNYLMSKRLTCGMCGAAMSGTNRKTRGGKRLHYYFCCAKATPERYTHTCNSRYYRGDYLDEAVWAWLKQLLTEPQLLRMGLQAQQEQTAEQNAPLQEQLASVEALLEQKQARQERLLDLYLDQEIPKATWLMRKQQIEGEISKLEREREVIRGRIEVVEISDEQIQTIHEFATTVAQSFDLVDEDFAAKRKVVELLDVQAKLYTTDDGERKAEVSCFFGDKDLYIVPTATSGCLATAPSSVSLLRPLWRKRGCSGSTLPAPSGSTNPISPTTTRRPRATSSIACR